MHNDITDIPGIRVGHDTNLEAGTGCTVILCDTPAVGGVDVRGGAPATRETDLLHPLHMVEEVHAIVLTGGSAFGLDAAGGVMRYLEEHSIGIDVQKYLSCLQPLFSTSVLALPAFAPMPPPDTAPVNKPPLKPYPRAT